VATGWSSAGAMLDNADIPESTRYRKVCVDCCEDDGGCALIEPGLSQGTVWLNSLYINTMSKYGYPRHASVSWLCRRTTTSSGSM
jgi:hypothetical protein